MAGPQIDPYLVAHGEVIAARGATAFTMYAGPGDYIDLRADVDLLVAISNCPQERNPCNGWNPTPIEVQVYEPEPRVRGGIVSA